LISSKPGGCFFGPLSTILCRATQQFEAHEEIESFDIYFEIIGFATWAICVIKASVISEDFGGNVERHIKSSFHPKRALSTDGLCEVCLINWQ
jgi:hypothetical protein